LYERFSVDGGIKTNKQTNMNLKDTINKHESITNELELKKTNNPFPTNLNKKNKHELKNKQTNTDVLLEGDVLVMDVIYRALHVSKLNRTGNYLILKRNRFEKKHKHKQE